MSDVVRTWFFRDLSSNQRLKLFESCGIPVGGIGNSHIKQALLFDLVFETQEYRTIELLHDCKAWIELCGRFGKTPEPIVRRIDAEIDRIHAIKRGDFNYNGG